MGMHEFMTALWKSEGCEITGFDAMTGKGFYGTIVSVRTTAGEDLKLTVECADKGTHLIRGSDIYYRKNNYHVYF
jgi:hypothetical protein